MATAVRALISLILVGLLLFAGATGFRKLASMKRPPAKEQVLPPRTAVRVQAVRPALYQESIEAYGRARAIRRTTVSAEVSGRVVWLADRLEAGAAVDSTKPLVKLDDRDQDTAVESAAARLKQAQAASRRLVILESSLKKKVTVATKEYDSARAEYERIEKLVDKKVSSQTELDRRRLSAGQMERLLVDLKAQLRMVGPDKERNAAEIRVAASALKRAKLDHERATIFAPYAGHVLARRAHVGQRVAPGTPLFELVDNTVVEIPLALPVSRYGEVAPGAKVELRIASARSGRSSVRSSAERAHLGRVVRIAPEIDVSNQTFLVYVQLSGKQGQPAPIPPGAFVHAGVHGRQYADVIALPRAIFVDEALFVAEPDPDVPGEAIVRRVEARIHERLSDVYLIREGLPTGSRVVLTNLEQIGEGSRVQLIK